MKFLVFIALLVLGWYALSWFQQFEISRRPQQRTTDKRGGADSANARHATETIACARCGTYVPADFPTACDRTGCPFPGVG
jgi:hypothetical protein